MQALYEIHKILKQHDDSVQLIQIQQQTIELLVDRVTELEKLTSKGNAVEQLIFDQFDSIRMIKADAPSYQSVHERLEKLESVAQKLDKCHLNGATMGNRISVLEDKVQKIQLSKCDAMKSLKDKQEHLKKEICALAPAFKAQTSAVESQLKTVEADFEAHKTLLDEMHKKLVLTADCIQPCVNVSTPAPRSVPEEVSSPVLTCDRCGGNTHDSSTCGAKWLWCRQCGEVGHLARCCPVKQCHRCGLQNHSTEECRATCSQCWTCGMRGHLQRMCPQWHIDRFNQFKIS